MSGSGRFCPRCGDSIDEEGFPTPDARGDAAAVICRECYLHAIDLVTVPDRVRFRMCTSCGDIHQSGAWDDLGVSDYTEAAIDAVAAELRVHRDARNVNWTVEPIQRGPNELDIKIEVTASVEGAPIVAERTVSVRISRETCPSCGRKAGDYYAGTVQVRGTSRVPTAEEQNRAIALAHEIVDASDDRDAFVSEVNERPEGVDIRVSSNKVAQQISNRVIAEFGGTYETAETLVTEDEDGEGVYRVAFAIRLPRFRPGDIIESDSDIILVLGDVRGRDLTTGEEVTVDEDRKADATRLATDEDVIETTLVAVEDANAIQVLDPETAASVTISRPADLPVDRQTIPTVKVHETLYAIPEDVLEEVRS